VAEQANVRLRVVPLTQPRKSGADRYTKIQDAVDDGKVAFRLELAATSGSPRWSPLARIVLQSEVDAEDQDTQFWPFRAGQGIRPQGFVQFMRPLPYLLSQWSRGVARR
jgi:hypothetical protein